MTDSNQQLSNLDPKLKEAYERVMGTQPAPSTTNTNTHTSASVNPPQQPSAPTVNINPNQAQPTSPHVINIGPTLHPIGARREPEKIQIGGSTTQQTHGYVAQKKKNILPMPLLIIGGIIFLIVYTIFWLKFFQVPVPFLPF